MAYEIATGVAIAGQEVKARELTLREHRELQKAAIDRAATFQSDMTQYDALAEGLFEDISLYDLAFIAGVSLDDLGGLRTTELRKVADACIRANQDFFSMKARQKAETKRFMDSQPDMVAKLLSGDSMKP